ncbi:uncharacterized protein F4807DRAFT_451758 [Annulohypoxylon truncatum]|uniref:uncharacterized protein n=1 Tax=Annulohypoxylon truncatum TaxID=327061 RepID=UPI002008C400|nr:uncharacterized protein F4807DRAFT_451758 [Annulohypoxylon truncatum]KAI1209395.1 hypothetical protein F4807DRAFT_451758 [Annulohypoxylon truncatum]
MKIPTFLILAFGAITGSGVQLSEDIADGLFTADFSSGNLSNVEMLALHEREEPADINTSPNPQFGSRITQRSLPVTQASCSDFMFVDSADYLQSLQKLQNYCNAKPNVKSKGIVGFKVGSAIAYMCNYGKPIQCLTDELNDDMNTLNTRCHSQQKTGFVWHKGVKKTYGRSLLTESICDNM